MDAQRLRVAMTAEQCWHPVPGGSGRYITSLGRALMAGGQVDVRGVAAHHASAPAEGWVPSFPVAHHRLPRVALYEAWQRLGRPRVQRVTGAVDVIHATTWAIPPRTAPLVVTVHDLAFLHERDHFTRRGNAYFRRALAQVRRLADVVITPSRQTAEDCIAVDIAEPRIRVVPHGFDPVPVEDAEVAAFRRARGLHRPYVLWTGTREPRKNLPRLLDAFRMIRSSVDLDLVLVGPDGWGPRVQPDPADEGRIHLVGTLGYRDLHRAYAGARAFCYPSLREGFGLPVLEAMSHGIPVVTSVDTPMSDVVGPGGVCVEPTDTAAIAEALTVVTGGAHDRLAELAARRSGDFTWEKAAGQTVAAYEAATSVTRR